MAVLSSLSFACAGDAGFRTFAFEHAVRSSGENRVTKVYFWYPTEAAAGPFQYRGQQGLAAENAPVAPGRHPLVVFSHGYRGAGDQTIFLMEALARAGYLVAAPEHGDAMSVRSDRGERPGFADPESWTEEKFAGRREDVRHLLDHLLRMDAETGSFLHGRVNRDAIGGAGHSLGGYTMLALAGGWESWRDERLKAVLVVSPYAQPFLRGEALSRVQVPVMLQGGTQDAAITPFLAPVYRKLGAPKYFATLENANHFEWTNRLSAGGTTTECVKSGNAKLITELTVAFFDRHLRGKEGATLLDAGAPGLANYEHVK